MEERQARYSILGQMPCYDEETNKVGRCNRKADYLRAKINQAGDSFARKFIRRGAVNRHCCPLDSIQIIDHQNRDGAIPASSHSGILRRDARSSTPAIPLVPPYPTGAFVSDGSARLWGDFFPNKCLVTLKVGNVRPNRREFQFVDVAKRRHQRVINLPSDSAVNVRLHFKLNSVFHSSPSLTL